MILDLGTYELNRLISKISLFFDENNGINTFFYRFYILSCGILKFVMFLVFTRYHRAMFQFVTYYCAMTIQIQYQTEKTRVLYNEVIRVFCTRCFIPRYLYYAPQI